MGMMNGMMEAMINSFTPEEREELMLQMMPAMMKGVDVDQMMENMIVTMSKRYTFNGAITFVKDMLKQVSFYDAGSLLVILGNAKAGLMESMGGMQNMMKSMVPKMMKVMMPVMEKVMPKMMGMMSSMMPMMAEHMPVMMNETMIPMFEKKPEVKKNMLSMMQTVFPHCAENMFPLIDKEDRVEFINKLYGIMAKSAAGEMSVEEKKAFIVKSSNTIRQQFTAKNLEQ